MTITLTEQIGTSGNDTFTGTNLTGSIGLAGNDTFTSASGAQIAAFAGGEGSDSYNVGLGSTVLIYDSGNTGTDTLTVSGIDYLNSVFGIIDGRHLFAYDLTTSTAIYSIDWVSGDGDVDMYNLDGTLMSDDFLLENLTSAPNFAGYFTWDNPAVGFGFTGAEVREALEYYADRAEDLEALAQIGTGNSTVYRFYNEASGQHFYTASSGEAQYVAEDLDAYTFEGAMFGAGSGTGAQDVFRFFNTATGAHFYTISEGERDFIQNNLSSFQYEGAAYQAYEASNGSNQALYRFYNEATGTHFYTATEGERDFVIANTTTMNYEGIAFYIDDVA